MKEAGIYHGCYNLLNNFKSGNYYALKKIYELHYQSFCFYANKILDDNYQAEEIVAEGFVKLWEKREEFQSLESIPKYLKIVIRNLCLNYKQHLDVVERNHREIAWTNEGWDDPLSEPYDTEMIRLCLLEAEKLTGPLKEMFNLVYVEGYSVADVSKKTGIHYNTLLQRRNAALRQIKIGLGKKGLLSIFIFVVCVLANGHF
jgi:RNA polymerase sigma factor (sigma-70 family)